jgi:hypothetical protein
MAMTNCPAARKIGLLSETVGEETVVFDRSSQRAYRLNRSAAIVWRHCDGKNSVEDLAAIVRRELQMNEPAERVVEIALQKLASMKLLDGPPVVTRRAVGRKIALAAALIPAIAAIAVPTPAKASSVTLCYTGDDGPGIMDAFCSTSK